MVFNILQLTGAIATSTKYAPDINYFIENRFTCLPYPDQAGGGYLNCEDNLLCTFPRARTWFRTF